MIRAASHMLTVLVGALAAAGPGWAQADQSVAPEWDTRNDREFDFWVGAWDVVLRVRQPDYTWRDSRFATAKIYRILDGKAILELWDERTDPPGGIRGFSLRHFDDERGEWMLYLNWPGPNRSGMGTLSGRFRHGRGEFFSTSADGSGDTVISRYTFSDAAPDRLRWDDAYSRDGGRTWSNNWIMEFSRTADRASWPEPGGRAHTYYAGERCDRDPFREFELLDGEWAGEVTLVVDGRRAGTPARLTGHRVLDGCAVLSLLEYDVEGRTHREFSFKTYNTFADAFEDARMDNRRGTPLRSYYGQKEGDAIVLRSDAGAEAPRRYRWTFGGTDTVTVTVDDLSGAEPTRILEGRFSRTR